MPPPRPPLPDLRLAPEAQNMSAGQLDALWSEACHLYEEYLFGVDGTAESVLSGRIDEEYELCGQILDRGSEAILHHLVRHETRAEQSPCILEMLSQHYAQDPDMVLEVLMEVTGHSEERCSRLLGNIEELGVVIRAGGFRNANQIATELGYAFPYSFPSEDEDWARTPLVEVYIEHDDEGGLGDEDEYPEEEPADPTTSQRSVGETLHAMYSGNPSGGSVRILASTLNATEAVARTFLEAGPGVVASALALCGSYLDHEGLPEEESFFLERAERIVETYQRANPADQALCAKTLSKEWGVSFEEAETILNEPQMVLQQLNAAHASPLTAWDMLDE